MNAAEEGAGARDERPAPVGPEGSEALLAHARALDGLREAQLELGRRLDGGQRLGERVERLHGEVERLRERQGGLEAELRGARRRGRGLLGALLLVVLAAPVALRTLPDDDLETLLRLLRGEAPARAAASGDDRVAAEDALDVASASEPPVPVDDALRARNEQFAELVRLRSELFETRSRLAALTETIEEVAQPRVEEPPRISTSAERVPDPLVTGVNAALATAGVRTVRVLEGRLLGGALVDVLLADADLSGGLTDARAFERLGLEVEKGAVRLRMRRAPTAQRQAGDEFVPLPRWNEASWTALGLAVPKGFVPLDAVEAAVGRTLAGQPYALRELGGFEGGSLLDVAFDELDAQGKLVRTWRAARGHFDVDGPALVLEEGAVLVDDDERPFFNGRVRLPLPGATLDAVLPLAGELP